MLMLAVVAACGGPVTVDTPTLGVPVEELDAGAWAASMCEAVDELEQAVGDPTTGERSTAWQAFETALTGSDETRLKDAANGVLGHLTQGSRTAAAARGFAPGAAAATELTALLDGLADGVRTLRDATLAADVSRVNEGRRLIDAAYEGHYEQALGQMEQVPLGGVPLPCG
jgi:hypothetical protein